MIKLLIVDDEQMERQGMEAILTKNFPSLIIQQAKNGKLAVELAQSFKPNLILMDIKMPGMNGLEAVEKIANDLPSTKFIMVTAFDTFSYMKAAIKLGVKDYILKPSKASEIVETVGKVLKQIEEEQDQKKKSLLQQEALQKALTLVETDVVTQLLFDHVHEVHVDMLMHMLDIPSTDEMFVMVLLLPEKAEQHYFSIKEKVRSQKSGWVGALYGNLIPIIVFRQTTVTYRTQASILARELISIRKTSQELKWFIGIGQTCRSFSQVRKSYQEAMVAAVNTQSQSKYRFYKDLLSSHENSESMFLKEKEFVELIRSGQWEQLKEKVMQQLAYYEKEGDALVYSQQRILEMLWLASRIMTEMGAETLTPIYTIQPIDYRHLRTETEKLLYTLRESYLLYVNRLEADTFQKIKQFIKENSDQDISLDSLARKVGLSPIYISKMFKEKQGINYIDFLTECRIEKAKHLLADTEKSIKEITFEVGYHDPNYFSKVFKKVTTTSPKEYRKTLQNQKEKLSYEHKNT
ncbi:response regulator [Sutcliffiella rhizosphaerae]|uniref:Protein-glutamate methylesterase/protein-glutamine glutaminase n=1 Tax=Sutcliffiella rhizosphaerae TaxID=2880967 RepID=A0ABM8YRJ2_9BACI|nr:response regulator [Sutcliffiella rhizosphaerae]CAG9622519.1 Protein-glutamate methylesterase/protein-glutamine glutaminase [Sutcliffiella rhizosphaerae]